MSKLQLKIYGDDVLRQMSASSKEFGGQLEFFLQEMAETMVEEGGVGLAAPQVGLAKRIVVINPHPENSSSLVKMINPRIISVSAQEEVLEEGCLSIPGIRGEVARSNEVVVEYQDEMGQMRELKAEGLLARIIQHETDHLNGVLFIDHFSFAKKLLIKPKLRDLLRNRREG